MMYYRINGWKAIVEDQAALQSYHRQQGRQQQRLRFKCTAYYVSVKCA